MDNTENQLRARLASVESKNDLLETELMYLNEMLVRCGFSEGIKTLKETVEELLSEESFPQHGYERPELI
jgi:hypothetical protein